MNKYVFHKCSILTYSYHLSQILSFYKWKEKKAKSIVFGLSIPSSLNVFPDTQTC